MCVDSQPRGVGSRRKHGVVGGGSAERETLICVKSIATSEGTAKKTYAYLW